MWQNYKIQRGILTTIHHFRQKTDLSLHILSYSLIWFDINRYFL